MKVLLLGLLTALAATMVGHGEDKTELRPTAAVIVPVASELDETIAQIRRDFNADMGTAWEMLARLVKPGMRRADVEKILPPFNDRKFMCYVITNGSGGAQCVFYWVDPDWRVSIFYDRTGVQRDAAGNSLSDSSPDNRVLDEVKVEKLPCPPRKEWRSLAPPE